jgi:hypothetical protein
MEVFLKEARFQGVMLDKLISDASEILKILQDIVTEGISAGVVQPLPRTVFPDTETEQAFRYSYDQGKCVGSCSAWFNIETDTIIFLSSPALY